VILDEPVNGLDPEGVMWVRNLLKSLAEEGRTVLVSSHLMSEMALTAEHLIVIGRGRLLADASMNEFVQSASATTVRVRAASPDALAAALARNGVTVGYSSQDPGLLEVTGMGAAEIGEMAHAAGLPLHELTPVAASLEAAFMEMTRDSMDYTSHTASDGEFK
jgi:ABC-2 type transport system ATP-binding protein